jgi:hypothetical protein
VVHACVALLVGSLTQVEKRSTMSVSVSSVNLNELADIDTRVNVEDRSIGSELIDTNQPANGSTVQLSAVEVNGAVGLLSLTTTLGRRVKSSNSANDMSGGQREHQQRYILLECNTVYQLEVPGLQWENPSILLYMRSWRHDRTELMLHLTADAAIAARLPIDIPVRPTESHVIDIVKARKAVNGSTKRKRAIEHRALSSDAENTNANDAFPEHIEEKTHSHAKRQCQSEVDSSAVSLIRTPRIRTPSARALEAVPLLEY